MDKVEIDLLDLLSKMIKEKEREEIVELLKKLEESPSPSRAKNV